MKFYRTAPPTSPPAPQPQLMFFDRNRGLADRQTLSWADHGNDPPFSPTFAEALIVAKQVWIVDGYLAETLPLADALFEIVTCAKVEQVRIITAAKAEFAELQERAVYWNTRASRPGKIELLTLPKREQGVGALPHDRFALVDGILWHWGATVGGGYSGQNACSYGWSAQHTGAATWFDDLWRASR